MHGISRPGAGSEKIVAICATWKLFGEEVLKKLKETGARVEVSKGEINEINISKDLDLSNLVIN